MKYLNGPANYEKNPFISVTGWDGAALEGYDAIVRELSARITGERFVLAVDAYPGADEEEIRAAFARLNPRLTVSARDCFKPAETLSKQLRYHLTDDRVFGKMYFGQIADFMDQDKAAAARERIAAAGGLILVYGFGAALLCRPDMLVYADMARWEIQLRYRKGMGNYLLNNGREEPLKKYKCGFFIEWRVADKHKMSLFDRVDYFLDTNRRGRPKLAPGDAVRDGLRQAARQPFRTVPYFDPGVWGGKWMEEVCALEPAGNHYAWCFDGVPEENSLLLSFGGVLMEFPAMDLVLYQPEELLGEQVYARFGAEFPIRFDFLDTMEGGNLSLQVHPLTEYIKKQFGMSYTQDESYYILDAAEDACVYLGLKDGVAPEEMLTDLQRAQDGGAPFDAEKYVNCWPAKKHDHFLIPAGTLHCSGKGSMVLEISATPYIFTFKLWDWGRLGLDGRPRPVHIQHGRQVIRWERTTQWVKDNLVGQVETLRQTDTLTEERTGLHALEFIETRRLWLTGPQTLDTNGTVHMLNLVEGREAVVESPDGAFSPFTVHYAETFIIPASVSRFRLRPAVQGEKIGVVAAHVR